MKIKLIDSEVVSLNVSTTSNIENAKEMEFRFEPFFSDSDTSGAIKTYFIIFNLLIHHKNNFYYQIKYKSEFQVDEDITPDFKKSPFVYVNSPAIAYPFLRSYVANLMLISGHDPMMLPTINFTTHKNLQD